MKKLLLVAILMLALVVTIAACSKDQPSTETGAVTTAGENATVADPAETTAAPADTDAETGATETGATETGATETGVTETGATETSATETGAAETEPETEDPNAPVNIFWATNIAGMSGQKQIASAVVEDNYLHVVPAGTDPYWFPFSYTDGARYVVIRYRTDATGANMQFFMASTGSKPSNDSSMLQQPIVDDGEWHLAVYDTQPLIDAGIYDGSFVSYFRFDPLEAGYILNEDGEPYKDDNGNWYKYELPENCSIDIE